jgi:uncharacterized protein YggE
MLLGMSALGTIAVGCGDETTVVLPAEQATGITVSGDGEVFGEPDIAMLSLGVEVERNSVGEAREAAATTMEAILAALKENGVAEEDIQTTRFSVEARYDYPINEPAVLRGFAVNNVVAAKIRNIDDTGTVIDGALEAGGNAARIESLQFTIDDASTLEDEARKAAMAAARAKAETLAGEAGVELSAPISITESGGPVPIAFDDAAAADFAQETSRTPIEAGLLQVDVQVQVVYGLE